MICNNTQNFNKKSHLINLPKGLFQVSAPAWRENVIQLAEWTQAHLVNRDDTYGSYYRTGGPDCQNTRAKQPLTQAELISHFGGLNDRVGLYCYDKEGFGKWICIDIDAHEGVNEENWDDVVEVLEQLHYIGINPLVEHSNGDCGFKLWILFDTALPCSLLRSFGLWLCRTLPTKHEVFPKHSVKTEYGNYVRLPGKHHKKKDWWSEFYDVQNLKWYFGQEAVSYLLGFKPNSVAAIPEAAKTYVEVPEASDFVPTVKSGNAANWEEYKGNIATLDIKGLSASRIISLQNTGVWKIVCPWADEHTTGEEAFIFERQGDSWASFFCHHAHCKHRGLKEYLSCFPKEEVNAHCSKEFKAPKTNHVSDELIAKTVETKHDDDLSDLDLFGSYDGLEMIRKSQNTNTEHLFEGLLETGVITLFCGLPYSGKSIVVLQAIRSLIQGTDFYGRKCRLPQTPVLYINADGLRDRQFHRRLLSICDGDEGELLAIAAKIQFSNTQNLPSTVDDEYLRRLIRGMKKKHGSDTVLIVIDTLRPAFLAETGPGSENDPGTMTKLLGPIRKLAGETNCPVWLLHHNNRGKDKYSGSAAIAGTTDAVWTISKKTDTTSDIEVEDRDIGRCNFSIILGKKDTDSVTLPIIDDKITEFINRFPVGVALTRKEISELFPELSERTLRRMLEDAERAGVEPRLEKLGTGKPNDPYKYMRV